jgi:hypothetical protein
MKTFFSEVLSLTFFASWMVWIHKRAYIKRLLEWTTEKCCGKNSMPMSGLQKTVEALHKLIDHQVAAKQSRHERAIVIFTALSCRMSRRITHSLSI